MVYRNKADFNPQDISIGILYSAAKTESANALKQKLEEIGMQVKTKEVSSVKKDYIAIHNLDLAGETISELKKIIPEIKERHAVYDPIGINRTGRDLTVVIAD